MVQKIIPWNGMGMEWKLIKLCAMEWKWNENKFRKFHESIWDENNYKFQHFLMNKTNCLLIIHNKKTFYYRTLSCEMWILEFWKFFCSNIEWNGMRNEKKLVEWNGNGIQIFKILTTTLNNYFSDFEAFLIALLKGD